MHVTSVTNNSISLAWVPPDVNGTDTGIMSNYSDFVIQYGKVNNMTMYETVVKLDHVSRFFYFYIKLSAGYELTSYEALCLSLNSSTF